MAAFLSKVEVKDVHECWLWKGCTYNCGYGSFLWRGKMRAASRVAWEIAHGRDVPEGLDILHRCDNRLCVNPAHLWAGTHIENMHDMRAKGRHPLVALKDDEVREIRALIANGARNRDIAQQYGISQSQVYALKVGKTYARIK